MVTNTCCRHPACPTPTCLVTKLSPSLSPGPREEATLAAVKGPAILHPRRPRKEDLLHSSRARLPHTLSDSLSEKQKLARAPLHPHSTQSSISPNESFKVMASQPSTGSRKHVGLQATHSHPAFLLSPEPGLKSPSPSLRCPSSLHVLSVFWGKTDDFNVTFS